ncbi:MAG TPA: glycosyltransferase [Gemmataceae bacterium]|jgi:glycosyltransferase involved in cell wall biosynthesis|nr:glycosyltransferase [Gemmataceae bacterium]
MSEARVQQIIVIFSDDWGRHPSSCQHLAKRLLQRHRVLWVNTIGMRTPHFNALTLLRGFEKIRQWLRPKPAGTEELPVNLEVLNPKMWPWMRSRFDRALNRWLLKRQLVQRLQALEPEAVAVTTVPIVADLVGILPVRRWLYYCVDDFSQWPGLDQAAMDKLERELVAQVDTCVAVSETLQDRLMSMGATSHLLTHGVDVDFWTTRGQERSVPAIDDLPKPLIVFWGLKDRRLDVEFVRYLSAKLEHGTIVLAGPENEPDPALKKLPHVCCVPALPYEDLPQLGDRAAVLIMPYGDLPVTRAMQPLKLKEYLATGRPVVARDLPSLHEWADCVDLVSDPEAFAETVMRRLQTGIPPEQRAARGRLANEDWDAKAEQFEGWLMSDVRTAAAAVAN